MKTFINVCGMLAMIFLVHFGITLAAAMPDNSWQQTVIKMLVAMPFGFFLVGPAWVEHTRDLSP